MGFYKVLVNSILCLTLFGSILGQQHESNEGSFEDPTVGGVSGNPGAKLRFSTKALDAIYDHALLKITEKLTTMKLPESTIPIDGGVLSIKSARITEAKIPNYSRDMAPPNQIHSHLYGAMIKSEGEWHYRPQGGVRSISSGVFRSHVNNAELNATSKFDGTKDGRPMVSVASCEARLGQFRVEIEGYGNESKPYVIDKCDNVKCKSMVDFFEGAVCNAARNYVSEYVNKKLATFPTKVNLGKDFFLDYRMLSCDSVADDYIQGDLEGEVVSRSGGSANFHPVQLSPMPMGKPISFSLGDYAFNTLFHQAHQQQFPFSAYDLLANNSALWQSLSLNCSSSPKTRELESSPSTEKSSPSTAKSTPSSSKSTKSSSTSKSSTRRSSTTRSSTVKSTSTSRPSTTKSTTEKSSSTSRPSTTKSSTEKSSSTSRPSTSKSSTMKSTSTSRPSTTKSSTMKSSPTSRSSTMKSSTSPRSSPTSRSSTTKLSTTPRSTSTKSSSMRSTSTPKSTSISSSASTSTTQSSTRTGPTRRGFRKQPNVQNKPNKPTSQCLGSIFDNSADGQQFQSNGLGNLVFRSQRPVQVFVNAQSQKSHFSTQGGLIEIYEAGDHSEKPRSAKVIFRANVKSLNGVFLPKLNGSNISGAVEVQKLELSQQSNQLRHRSISNDQLSKLSEFAKPILSAMFNSFLEQFAQFPVPLIEGYECSQPGFRWTNRTMQIDCDIRVLANAIRRGGKDPKNPKKPKGVLAITK